jgi:hypothetical protein
MTITLQSGLVVESKQYYTLLDWKDKYPSEFGIFINDYDTSSSINRMTRKQYDQLVAFATHIKPSWNFKPLS